MTVDLQSDLARSLPDLAGVAFEHEKLNNFTCCFRKNGFITTGRRSSRFSGAGPAALAELFPTHSGTMLMSTGYSVAVAIFGGFAPFIATGLISATGSPISPAYHLIFSGVLSGLIIWGFHKTVHERLR